MTDAAATEVLGEDATVPEAEQLRPRGYAPLRPSQILVDVPTLVAYVDGLRARGATPEQLSEPMLRTQRLESLGRLAGGVAHDFNNLLTVITNYAHVLRERGDNDASTQRALQNILEAAHRGEQLTHRLLAFGRRQPIHPQRVHLNAIIEDVQPLLQSALGGVSRLELVLDASLWSTRIDVAQFEQVLINLAVNARDAMTEGGVLTIETSNGFACAEAGADERLPIVRVRVADNGVGMDEEVLRHVFEPFFTTKAPGQGTGLGLASAYGVIEQHRGKILIDSAVGEGTTVTIELPAMVERGESPPSPRVLLVDDDAGVLNAVRAVLELAEFRVVAVSSGRDGIEALRRSPDDVHVAILDVVMPDMDGPETLRALRSIVPSLPAILTSGYSRNAAIETDERTSFLGKPYPPGELVQEIRRLLAERRANADTDPPTADESEAEPTSDRRE